MEIKIFLNIFYCTLSLTLSSALYIIHFSFRDSKKIESFPSLESAQFSPPCRSRRETARSQNCNQFDDKYKILKL